MGRGPMGPKPFGGADRNSPPSAASILEHLDQNKDGKLTKSEVPEFVWDRLSKADANQDGEITKDELDAHRKEAHPSASDKPIENAKPAEPPRDEKPATSGASTGDASEAKSSSD